MPLKTRGPHDAPTPYVVEYDDERLYRECVTRYGEEQTHSNPDWFRVRRDFNALSSARRFAATVMAATIIKRSNFWSDTPPEITWETWWRWDEEIIA